MSSRGSRSIFSPPQSLADTVVCDLLRDRCNLYALEAGKWL